MAHVGMDQGLAEKGLSTIVGGGCMHAWGSNKILMQNLEHTANRIVYKY